MFILGLLEVLVSETDILPIGIRLLLGLSIANVLLTGRMKVFFFFFFFSFFWFSLVIEYSFFFFFL